MKLVSIYIIKHHFLFDEPQTINFGGQYIYSFINKESGLFLERKMNHDYVEEFWGKNISLVSAIVGENGAGKTSLSGEISISLNRFFIDYKKKLTDPYSLFIFEDDGKTILKIKNLYLQDSVTHHEDSFYLEKYNVADDVRNRSSDLIFKELNFENDIVKIDFENMNYDNGSNYPFYFNLNRHFHDKLLISKQIEALISIPFLSDEILISKLEDVFGDISFIKSYNVEINESVFNFKSIEGFIFNSINPKEFITDPDLEKLLSKGHFIDGKYYFFNYLYSIFIEQNTDTGIFDLNGEKFQNKKKIDDRMFDYNCQLIARIFFKATIESYPFYQDLCKKFINEINYETLRSKENFLRLLNFIQSYNSNYNKFNDLLKKVILLVELTPPDFVLELNNISLKRNQEFINTYIEISKLINLPVVVPTNLFDESDIIKENFLAFKPTNNISDGERNLIKLFSIIHSNRDNISKLLILDEPEIGFHPLWKKKFVKAVTSVIPIILNKTNTNKIQIVFTTHDPLTLSDIPNNNIVYLNKKNGKSKILKGDERPQKSFGANITDLLADSFFIEDGLIGDFAKGKINDVIKWLNDDERDLKKKDDYKKIIEMIDEPLMKTKLSEMYYSRFQDEDKYNKEKEFIRRRAIELGLLKEEND